MNEVQLYGEEVLAKQVFTFPGAIPTKSKVSSVTDAKRLDFGGGKASGITDLGKFICRLLTD